MSAADLLIHLRSQGICLTADGGNLIITPRDALTDELRAEIRQHKPDLLRLVAHAPIDENGEALLPTLAEIQELDALIQRLCDLVRFPDPARLRMLEARKRMAPGMLFAELEYFRRQVARAEAGTYWENQE